MYTVDIVCPCCSEILTVDIATGEIVGHKPEKPAPKMDLDSFMKAQPGRVKELEDQFRKAKEDQERRKRELDEQFFKAKKDPSSIKGDYVSPFDMD